MSSAPPPGALSVVDLFSGAGGMSCGFHLAGGFHHRLAVDAQRRRPSAGQGKCNTTFELNFGHAPLDADLASADPDTLVRASGLKAGELDVLISCAPCTGFSAKLRRDYDDARNSLVARTALYVAAWKPRVLVMENVPEMLRGAHRHHGEALIQALDELGYAVRAEIINLGDYGVPQRRRRTLLVAARDGEPIPWPTPSTESTPTVWQAIGHLPPLTAGETDPDDPHHRAPGLSPAVLARTQVTPPDGGSWKDYAQTHPEHLIPSMRRNADSGSYCDAYGRMHWHRPAPTITRECASPGNGRYLHPEQHRLCSLREMSLLQGFPGDYQWAGDLAGRYNQVGDAVPPRFALQLARSIRRALEAEDQQIQVN